VAKKNAHRKARRKLRILQLCTRFPPGMGGVETHVHAIATELKARGHDVQVFTSDLLTETPFKRIDPEDPQYDSVDGVPVKRFKARGLSGDAQYSFMPAMMNAVMAEKADIVHAHSYGFFQTHIALAARRMGHARFVITPHFHPEWASGKTAKRKFLRRVYDRVVGGPTLGAADAVICVSRGEAASVQELGFDPGAIRIIPNGIPASLLTLEPDPYLFAKAYKAEHPLVLFVGRLAENKGLDVLVKAAGAVIKARPEVRFALVGEDGGMGKAVAAQARALGISGNFLLTGRIEDDAMFRSAFAACDIFVLPSVFEAFGIVILEAMAMGKPCVATKVGGIPDLVNDGRTGLLVEPGDHSALAKALLSLLDDPKTAAEMGEAGRKEVGTGFTWPKIVDRLEQVYAKILDR